MSGHVAQLVEDFPTVNEALVSIPALHKLDVVAYLCKFKTSQGYLRSCLRERGGGQGGSLTLGF